MTSRVVSAVLILAAAGAVIWLLGMLIGGLLLMLTRSCSS